MVINYVPGPTTLHRLTGGTKVLLFVLMTVAIIATYDIRLLIPLLIVNVAEIISMKPNYKPILFMFVFTFITVTVIGNIMLFVISPNVGLTNVGANNVIWQGSERFYLTKEFLWYILVVWIKRTASFASVMAFALATTPSEFASGLNFIGMPYKVCTVVSLAYRTIPDIANSFINIRNSMMMRGVEMSKKAKLGPRIKSTAMLLVPLIFTAFGKVGNIANAMDLRGYGKHKKRTWYAEHELTKADRVIRALLILFAAAIVGYIVWTKWIHPYPTVMWCPWVAEEEVQSVNVFDTIFFLKWFKK